MELSQYGELFLAESREHLSAMNHLLLELEEQPAAREPLEGVFRAVHTIKGMSATMGYRVVADVAHELENLLDLLRRRMRPAEPAVIDLLFQSADALERAIGASVEERETGYHPSALLERLRVASRELDRPESPARRPAGAAAPAERSAAAPDPFDSARNHFEVRVGVDSAAPLPGVRAFLALRAAREFGRVDRIDPPEPALQESDFAGTFGFFLHTEAEADAVEQALRAVGELAEVRVGAVEAVDVAEAAPEPETSAALVDEVPIEQAGVGRARQIRVDLRRLDALVNQIGELVIVRDRLQRVVGVAENPEVGEVMDQAARLVGELQDEIMRVRMVPVWQVFDRFPRLVRDAARSLGKRVNFELFGKDIEFDRSMLDEMGDPLVHLLRNSLDHGIEPPEERRAAGKPETALLQLTASRERSRAVIQVADDGRGIRRERVLAKAIESGLIGRADAATLSDEEVYRLILQPGFSTAEQVSDVSGRGVGMDVVATRVRSVGGTLDIESEEGVGTTITLRLPLTLAIVHALLVRLEDETYAIPLAHVAETTEFLPADVYNQGGRRVAVLRDEVIPLITLRDVLRYDSADARELLQVVVLEIGDNRIGVEVDELLGQQEIVVKGFDSTADTLRVFSGATILSDGRPALILDAGSLLAAPSRTGAAAPASTIHTHATAHP